MVTYGETSNRTTDESFGDIRLIFNDACTQTDESFLAKPKVSLIQGAGLFNFNRALYHTEVFC